jgi:hypothetical protein
VAEEPKETPLAPNAAGLVQQNSNIEFEGDNRPAYLPPEVTDQASFVAWYDKGGQGAAFEEAGKALGKLGDDGQPLNDDGTPREEPKDAPPKDPAEETPKPPEEKAFTQDPRTDDEIKASLKELGGLYAQPGYEKAALEFARTGDVSEATLAETAAAFGVTPEVAKSVFDSQKALAEANGKLAAGTAQTAATAQDVVLKGALDKIVPDDADYAKVLEWGKGALPEATQRAYNKALDSKDADTASALLTAMYDQYKAAGNGPAPRDVSTEAQPASLSAQGGPRPFASKAEQQAAISDPRYEASEAFRNGVIARIKVSNV